MCKVEVIRGNHYLISKKTPEAKILEKETDLFIDLFKALKQPYWNYLKQLPLATAPFARHGEIILFTDQDVIKGVDGKDYPLKELDDGKKKLKDSQLKDMFTPILNQADGKELPNSWKATLIYYISRLIKSRKRNFKRGQKLGDWIKEPDSHCPKHEAHTIHSPKSMFKFNKEGELLFCLSDQDSSTRRLDYLSIPKANYEGKTPIEKFYGKSAGGNLVKNIKKRGKHHRFTMQHKRYVHFDYIPEDFVGFDINRSPENWLTFADLKDDKIWVIELKGEAAELVERRRLLNRDVDNNNRERMKSSQRKPLRYELKKVLPKRQKKLIRKIFIPILTNLKKEKKGLAIDGCAAGGRSGSFLQDTINKTLPLLCEDMGVPYEVVDPRGTSQTCSACDETVTRKKSGKSKDHNVFRCTTEGCTNHKNPIIAHHNEAINIAKWGKKSFMNRIE